jgi:hypothetical protein
MPTITFASLDGAVERPFLPPQAPVAWFTTPDGAYLAVRAARLSSFTDIQPGHWPTRLRPRLVKALCRSVTSAPLAADGTLDLSGRFAVSPDRDSLGWRVRGFQHLGTVDRKLVKHVLGCGERDPDRSTAFWSRILGRPIDTAGLLATLSRVGCTAWQEMSAVRDVPDLYAGLTREAQLACIDTLAELREAYMRAAQDAMRSAGSLRQSRHVHQGTETTGRLQFLDDRGLWVSAAGSSDDLAIASCYDCLAAGEDTTGPATLRNQRRRITNSVARDRLFAIHTPIAWGF